MGLYSGPDREACWVALTSVLRTALASGDTPLLATFGRQHVAPPALAAEQQPALFVVQMRETRKPGPVIGAPVQLALAGFLILYVQVPSAGDEPAGAETQVGGTVLNRFLQAIDDALAPDDVRTGKCTLGGLVQHCWIEGDVDMDPGIFAGQGAAILPIKMLVP